MANNPQEFKDRLVELHRQGHSFNDLAREFSLAATSISNWVRAAERRDSANVKGEVRTRSRTRPRSAGWNDSSQPRRKSSRSWEKHWPSSHGGWTRSRVPQHPGGEGQRPRGRSELTADCQGFRGTLATKVLIYRPGDPEAKGLVERLHDHLERSFLPGREFTSPGDFNAQPQEFLARPTPATTDGWAAGPPTVWRPIGPGCSPCRRCRRWWAGTTAPGCRAIGAVPRCSRGRAAGDIFSLPSYPA
jgi:hypothetical protein